MGKYWLRWISEAQIRVSGILEIDSWHSWLRWWLLAKIVRVGGGTASAGYYLKWTSESTSRVGGYFWVENDGNEGSIPDGMRVSD